MAPLALLFDLDGTLIDSIELLLSSMEFAFANRTRRPTRAEWTAGIGTPLRTQLAEWSVSAEDTLLLLDRYREFQSIHLEQMTSVYPHVPETLAWARAEGHKLALVTSKGRGMTDRSLSHVGLTNAFDTIVTAESTDRHKPLPEPVWHALDCLSTSRERALFVGDSTHDMFAGQAAGVVTGAACWGPFSRAELAPSAPTFWLESMTELPDVIRSLSSRT